ncbi:hypothetical protein D9M72_568180 [compost metagenome]
MLAIVWRHLRLFAIDEQIEHMCFDRAIDDGEVLAVIKRVKNRHFQRRGFGDRSLTRLQIDLYAELFRERLQACAEIIDRIIVSSEMNTAAKADPFNAMQK